MKSNTLWTRDVTLLTIGTVISIIGGQAIQLPLSLTVYKQTESVFQSGLLFVASLIPSTVLPLLVAPVIDRSRKKPYIVGLDYLLAVLYVLIGYVFSRTEFQLSFYIAIALAFGTISSVYSVAFQAWFPDLIPKGFEHKGYAVAGTLYPTITIVMAPLSTFLFEHVQMYVLFYAVGILIAIAATFELFICETFVPNVEKTKGLRAYLDDLCAGIQYIAREKGIRNIYGYMGITNAVSQVNVLYFQAFFQTAAWLGAALYGALRSAETIGRLIGGVLQYRVVVPAKKRFGITRFVYYTYELFDMLLLFLPYPLMLLNRFLCGGLGMTSATLRQASVQSYLLPEMRAKVNAVFHAYTSAAMILLQLVGGVLGDRIGSRPGVVVLSGLCLIAIYVLIDRPREINRKVYEAERAPAVSPEGRANAEKDGENGCPSRDDDV